EQTLPVDFHAGDDSLIDCRPDAFGRIVIADHGGQHAAFHALILEAVVEIGTQHGVRADLDKDVDTLRHDAAYGFFEQHRFAHVVPPVSCAQFLAFHGCAGNGGVVGH